MALRQPIQKQIPVFCRTHQAVNGFYHDDVETIALHIRKQPLIFPPLFTRRPGFRFDVLVYDLPAEFQRLFPAFRRLNAQGIDLGFFFGGTAVVDCDPFLPHHNLLLSALSSTRIFLFSSFVKSPRSVRRSKILNRILLFSFSICLAFIFCFNICKEKGIHA